MAAASGVWLAEVLYLSAGPEGRQVYANVDENAACVCVPVDALPVKEYRVYLTLAQLELLAKEIRERRELHPERIVR